MLNRTLDKRLLSSFVNGLSAFLLSAGWLTHLEIKAGIISIFTGIGTTLYYTFCSYSSHARNKWILTALILLTGLLSLTLEANSLNKEQFLITGTGLLLLGFYPILLRTIPYVKSIVISSCWTFFILVLPTWISDVEQSLPIAELILAWGLFYALTIPSDIRDKDTDQRSMGTLPQIAGSANAGFIGLLLIAFFGIGNYLLTGAVLMLLFTFIALFIFGWFLSNRSLWLESATDAMLLLLGSFYYFI